MASTFARVATLLVAGLVAYLARHFASQTHIPAELPPQAQLIDQKGFNVLANAAVLSPSDPKSLFIPPGLTKEQLQKQPFHVYDPEFLAVIGDSPALKLIATSEKDPLFHEAVVWYKTRDEVFFVQNAGHPDAGTGLKKSAIVQKISLSEADEVLAAQESHKEVTVHTVPSNPMVINPNGATNYRRNLVFAGEGQGAEESPALWLMNPEEPYNTTVLLNNFYGRQFNSLNDVAVHPRSKDLYFTDVPYGYLQDFRPPPSIQNQVYRYNDQTGAVDAVADGFELPNGLTFSPDGAFAYVSDTGINRAFHGYNHSKPASIYRFTVMKDGTFENRKLFAHVSSDVPDGVHCDTKGNVYAGCGDGVHVWNPSGKLIGKIFTGNVVANFQFAGDGRMVICAETELYYAKFKASDPYVRSEM